MSRDYITDRERYPAGSEPGTGYGDVQMQENIDLIFGDNEELKFGDASDVAVKWDGSVLEFLPVADDTGAINIGDGSTDIDFKVFLGETTDYVLFDVGLKDFILAGAATIQTSQTGSGYSFNLFSVTADGASNNTRGLRVNVTTTASQTQGDLQCIHGYLTLGSGVTLGANAAVYPLSSWLDVPSDITVGSGQVIAGIRVIVDTNGVDLSALAGGGESALFYGQTWAAASSAIEHGLRVIAGAGTTIKNALSIGGSGTFNNIIDITEWGGDTEMTFLNSSLKDSGDRNLSISLGDLASRAAVRAQVGASAGVGSLYISTAGEMYLKVQHANADTDWEVVSHAAADAG